MLPLASGAATLRPPTQVGRGCGRRPALVSSLAPAINGLIQVRPVEGTSQVEIQGAQSRLPEHRGHPQHSNEDLQIALTEAMTDEELLALIGDVDRWVLDACTNAPE